MSLTFDFLKKGPILFIGCHPDDIELGCGGLLNKLKNKISLYTLTLSKNQNNPKNKNLVNEHYQSLKLLGIKKNHVTLENFTTREFLHQRQEICDYLWKINKKIKPTTVFIPPSDLHQDHQVCNSEALRVFRDKTLLEYDVSRSTTYPKSNLFIKLSKKDLNTKIKALAAYKTYKRKNYFSKKSITSLMQSNGIKMNIPICEAFSTVSIVI